MERSLMRARVHSRGGCREGARTRVPRCGPHGELAISWLTAGAKETPPCVSARWDIPPTFSLGEAHGSLYVLVEMNRAGPLAFERHQCASILVPRANLENEAVAVKRKAV